MPIRLFLIFYSSLSLLLVWGYWPTLTKSADRWFHDPQYSHGYLVPLFSVYLLYRRRDILQSAPLVGSWWFALPFVLGLILRFAEARYFFNGLDQLSFGLLFLALGLALGGKTAFKWSWSASLFLIFMVPLPFRLQTAMAGQLQTLATQMSTAVLVTFGVPAISEGNIIVVENVRIGVVEACSGLGMMVTFAALAAGYVLITPVPTWIKVTLLAFSLPTALVANVMRITATAILFQLDQSEAAKALYHDLAGWIMIPVGCCLIILESWLLGRILMPRTELTPDAPLSLFGPRQASASN